MRRARPCLVRLRHREEAGVQLMGLIAGAGFRTRDQMGGRSPRSSAWTADPFQRQVYPRRALDPRPRLRKRPLDRRGYRRHNGRDGSDSMSRAIPLGPKRCDAARPQVHTYADRASRDRRASPKSLDQSHGSSRWSRRVPSVARSAVPSADLAVTASIHLPFSQRHIGSVIALRTAGNKIRAAYPRRASVVRPMRTS